MRDSTQPDPGQDPFNLGRFLKAQASAFDTALSEIQSGRKQSHWMWFIFPQLEGLGSSATAQFYAIKNRTEAQAYLAHPILGPRLVQCVETLLRLDGRSAHEILGSPDDMKLKSCATLFAAVLPPGSLFEQLLLKYYPEGRDERTLRLLAGE